MRAVGGSRGGASGVAVPEAVQLVGCDEREFARRDLHIDVEHQAVWDGAGVLCHPHVDQVAEICIRSLFPHGFLRLAFKQS